MNSARLGLFLLACLGGCVRRIEFGPRGQLSDPREILTLMAQGDARVVSLEGEGKLEASSPQGNASMSLFIAVKRPASLHLEALDFFGRPAAVLATDGEKFALYKLDQGKFYRGAATAENIARFAPVALSPTELVGLLLGQVPLPSGSPKGVSLDPKRRAYSISYGGQSSGMSGTLWVHAEYLRAQGVELGRTPGLIATYDRFEAQESLPFAKELEIWQGSGHLKIDYRQVTLNAQVDSALFQLGPPEGVEVIEVR